MMTKVASIILALTSTPSVPGKSPEFNPTLCVNLSRAIMYSWYVSYNLLSVLYQFWLRWLSEEEKSSELWRCEGGIKENTIRFSMAATVSSYQSNIYSKKCLFHISMTLCIIEGPRFQWKFSPHSIELIWGHFSQVYIGG